MPAGYWIAVAIQAIVLILMLIGRKKMGEEEE